MAYVMYSYKVFQKVASNRPRLHLCKRCNSTSSVSPQNYCLDLVRNHDYENFLCTLLLPSTVRSAAFAVRGFNVEISKVQDQVSEAHLAQMRLHFWQETVDKLFKDNVPQHPVAQELYKAIQRHKLQKQHLKSLVSARAGQVTSPVFTSLDAIEQYAESSVSPVYYLLLQASSIQNVHADHAASHLGKAQGIANLVRGLPHNSARRSLTLPHDVLARHNVSHEAVLRGKRDQSVKDVVFDVATRAKQHLDKARSMSAKVPQDAYVLLLPASATASYLDRLQRVDFDAFHPDLQRRHTLLPWTVFFNKYMKRY